MAPKWRTIYTCYFPSIDEKLSFEIGKKEEDKGNIKEEENKIHHGKHEVHKVVELCLERGRHNFTEIGGANIVKPYKKDLYCRKTMLPTYFIYGPVLRYISHCRIDTCIVLPNIRIVLKITVSPYLVSYPIRYPYQYPCNIAEKNSHCIV